LATLRDIVGVADNRGVQEVVEERQGGAFPSGVAANGPEILTANRANQGDG
jgi:hypothetical protein